MKFIVDAMLGTLAKVLRILGFDTVYVRSGAPLALLVRARNQSRVLVTRNRQLKNHSDVFFIDSDKVEDQIALLLKRFSLEGEIRPFSRCLVCNGELKKVRAAEVANRIPFFIRRTQTEFSRCPECGRIYWPGSHRQAMSRRLSAICHVSRET